MVTPENARALTSDEFAALNAEGKTSVLRALFVAGADEGELEDNRTSWQKQLDWYRQAVALGGHVQVFADLNVEGKASVLRSLVNSAVCEDRLENNLARCLQVIALSGKTQEFAELNAEGKEAVLKALLNAGIVERQLDDNRGSWQKKLDWFCQAAALGGQAQVFTGLNAEGKTCVLTALFDAGVIERELEDNCRGWKKQLDWFCQAAALGGQPKEFASLNPKGQELVLEALSQAGVIERRLEDDRRGWQRQLHWFSRVAALSGQPKDFASLTPQGQELVLDAIWQAGNIEGRFEDDRGVWQKQLEWYRQAAALGGQTNVFISLNAEGKASVLAALGEASLVEGKLEDNRRGWERQIYWSRQARALGGQPQVFSGLNNEGKAATLAVLLNAGSAETRLDDSREGWKKALDWYRQAVSLGEIHWRDTGTALPYWVASLFETAIALPAAGLPKRGWLSVWGVLCDHQWSVDCRDRLNDLLGLHIPGEAPGGADFWLQRSPVWGVNQTLPEHAQTVVQTARVRLAQLALMQRQDLLHSCCLYKCWPVRFEGLGHWVLAHVAVFAPQLLPPITEAMTDEQSLWQPDVQAIADVLRWKNLWSDETYRAPYYITTLLPSERIDLGRYAETAEHQGEMRSWFSSLHAGDPKPMAEALQAAWLGLMSDPFSALGGLCQWLIRHGLDEADARRRARDAVLTARCDDLLQEVLNQCWDQSGADRLAYRSLENARLTEAATATRGHTPLQSAMQHNLRFFANATLSQMLGAGETENKVDAERLWDLLQLQRLGVALAVKPKRPQGWSSAHGLNWDSEAKCNIQEMQNHLLVRSELHEEARQRGDQLPKANELNEPLEPFATYAREWKRMGWDLVLPTPQQTADFLREGQALVQLHLSQEGSALHALVLQPGTGSQHALRLHELGAEDIDVQAVTLAAKQWQQALAEWDAVSTSELNDDLYIYALSEPMQALQLRWQSWQASSHPLQKVMRWLHEKAPEGAVCVWPPAWSSLPWQALWAQPFERAEPLRCVASVGAWVQAQTRAAQENGTVSQPLEPVVLSSLDVWADGGESEVQAIAGMFGVEPQASNDLGVVMKALKTRGPVHLAMHGQFDAIDPWRSALVVEQLEDARQTTRGARLHVRKLRKVPSSQHQPDPTQHRPLSGPTTVDEQDSSAVFEQARLPAWALTQVEIQADITLGVCESLQEGQGEGQAAQLGATGLGAMLMAAGARSVAGSLWACDAWSAALFFEFWYEERREHPAALALQKAQRRLRELDEKSFLRRVGKAAPHVTERAQARCELARKLGWVKPFDHPSCWAAFALLGDAPALPELKDPSPSKRSVVEIFTGWLASWWHR
jgi:hypothetical protein